MMKLGVYEDAHHAVGSYFVPTNDKSHISFAHSFSHTDNYVIIWDCSMQFQHDQLVVGGSFFQFNHNRNLKFGLIPKNSSSHEDVIWIDSGESGAILHPLHAWEEVEETYINGSMISSRKLIKLWTPLSQDLDMDMGRCSSFRMVEFTFDIKDQKAVHEVINDSINTEMPVMPPPFSDKMNTFTSCVVFTQQRQVSNDTDVETRCTGTLASHDRFGFSGIFVDKGVFVGYAKWDLLNRCLASTVYYGENNIGGEPVVIRGSEDDEIYIGSYIYTKGDDTSYFDLYDAKTSERICRLKMPQRIPQGFHGTFISGQELECHFKYHDTHYMHSDSELWEELFRNSQQG
jgi:9-cis-epoxycarotenoid dioxygenase